LAYELATNGLKVLLLDKNPLPRDKVCAGGITVRAASLLKIDFHKLVENTIHGVRLSFKTTPKKVRFYDKPLAYMVTRDKFDYMLATRARDSGATLIDNLAVENITLSKESVTVQTNSGTFSTPVLVGADGANSSIVRSLGIKQGFEYGIGLNCHVPVSEDVYSKWDGLMGLDYGIAGGYGWIFPKHKHLSVGAGGPFRVGRILRSRTLGLIQNYGLGTVEVKSIQGHLMP
jgi:flavin-dependent dehydrogenase